MSDIGLVCGPISIDHKKEQESVCICREATITACIGGDGLMERRGGEQAMEEYVWSVKRHMWAMGKLVKRRGRKELSRSHRLEVQRQGHHHERRRVRNQAKKSWRGVDVTEL